MKIQKQKNNNTTKEEWVNILDEKFRGNEKSLDKKFRDNQNFLLKDINEKLEANQESMATMIRDAFQNTQDLFIEKFDQIDENFKQVNKKIDNISLQIVDAVHKEEFDKLETRVDSIETVLNLPKK